MQELKSSILSQSAELRKDVYVSESYGSSSEKEKLLAKIFAIYAILKAA